MNRAVHMIILLCAVFQGIAQEANVNEKKRYPFLQLNFHTGSFWTRSEYLTEQFSHPYKAIEARFGYQLTGKKLWQQYHKYPRYGFGLHYSDLVKNKSDTVVGNPFSLFGFYSGPWARFGRFTLASDLSLGLSYTGLTHDYETNPFNDVIASHINLYFDINLNLHMSLTPGMGINAGYGLTHYSNGRMHVPQKGVNNWGWTFGMNWMLNGPVKEFIRREPPAFSAKESIEIMYAVGTVEGNPTGTTDYLRFFTSSFTADYVWQFSPKGAVTIGLDVLYDGSLERAIYGVSPEEVSIWQQMYLASHMGYHVIVDRFTLLLNLGSYFRQHSFDRGWYYARVGGRYRLTDHLHAHIAIKTRNGIRADWIEWGAAYQIELRRKSDI
jgi:hypothetical protein